MMGYPLPLAVGPVKNQQSSAGGVEVGAGRATEVIGGIGTEFFRG